MGVRREGLRCVPNTGRGMSNFTYDCPVGQWEYSVAPTNFMSYVCDIQVICWLLPASLDIYMQATHLWHVLKCSTTIVHVLQT